MPVLLLYLWKLTKMVISQFLSITLWCTKIKQKHELLRWKFQCFRLWHNNLKFRGNYLHISLKSEELPALLYENKKSTVTSLRLPSLCITEAVDIFAEQLVVLLYGECTPNCFLSSKFIYGPRPNLIKDQHTIQQL